MRYAFIASFRGRKHVLYKLKILPIYELRQRATKYCGWEVMFLVCTVYASFPAIIPIISDSNVRIHTEYSRADVRSEHSSLLVRLPVNIFTYS